MERELSVVTMNCQHVRHETCNCFEIAPPSKPEKDKVMLNEPSLNENADVPTYTFACAMDVMRNNNISYDTKCGVFIIKQPKKEAKIVTLFSKTKCSCLSTGECFHILAAKLNLGMKIKNTHITTTNLTKLRKRNRSKSKKDNKRFKAVEWLVSTVITMHVQVPIYTFLNYTTKY